MNLKEVLHLETLELFRRKAPTVLLLLGIPILYSILFGFAYNSNVIKQVPTVVYDQDQTAASRALTQAYIDSERYQVVAQVTSREEVELLLRENAALVAVTIPPKFAQNIKLGMSTEILVETNSVNNMFGNVVVSSSQEIIQTFSAITGQKLLESLNQMPTPALRTAAPVKLGLRLINNPTTSYTNFILPGLMANGLQISILLVAGVLLTKEYKHLSRWDKTSSSTIVIGKLLPNWLFAVVAFLACLGIIISFFGIPFRGNVVSLLVLGSAFSFLIVNLSLFFSAISKDEVGALQLPLLYIMPGLLFSGFSWPYFAMNSLARFISLFMPLTYMADTLRDLLLAGYSPTLLPNVLIMFAGGCGIGLITIRVFSHQRKKFQHQTAKEALV